VLGGLICAAGADEDITATINWYKQNSLASSAWCALRGLLVSSFRRHEPADPYVVAEAKRILRKETAKDPPAALAAALIDAHQDSETITLAREQLLAPVVVTALLRNAPDEDVRAEGKGLLAEGYQSIDLILALMKTDPNDQIVLKAARRFVKKFKDYPEEKEMKSLVALLSSKQ
jgi:hypothetical protein